MCEPFCVLDDDTVTVYGQPSIHLSYMGIRYGLAPKGIMYLAPSKYGILYVVPNHGIYDMMCVLPGVYSIPCLREATVRVLLQTVIRSKTRFSSVYSPMFAWLRFLQKPGTLHLSVTNSLTCVFLVPGHMQICYNVRRVKLACYRLIYHKHDYIVKMDGLRRLLLFSNHSRTSCVLENTVFIYGSCLFQSLCMYVFSGSCKSTLSPIKPHCGGGRGRKKGMTFTAADLKPFVINLADTDEIHDNITYEFSDHFALQHASLLQLSNVVVV